MANTTKPNTENVFSGSKTWTWTNTCNTHFQNTGNKGGIAIDQQTWFWYVPLYLKLGKGQLVVVAANAPKEIIEDVEYYANLSEIPSFVYDGTSVDLGSVCGKPFTVATLIVNDPGDSTILDDLR